MTNPVAKISTYTAGALKSEDAELDIQIDANCVLIIAQEEAEDLLDPLDFSIVEFEPAYIGAPRPKKRPKS